MARHDFTGLHDDASLLGIALVIACLLVQTGHAEEDDAWVETESGVQYRIRIETRDAAGNATRSAIPLLYLDLRNTGRLKFGIEGHQSRHVVEFDGVPFERRDQGWGGVDEIASEGKPTSIPFLLSPGWEAPEQRSGPDLTLENGSHFVAIRLRIHEFLRDDKGHIQFRPNGSREITTTPVEIEVEQSTDESDAASIALENIRRELVVFPRFHSPTVTENLRRLTEEFQPASGDYLISALGHGSDMSPDPASFLIANSWDTFSRHQLNRYLKGSMSHTVVQRKEYPVGIDAGIGVGPRFLPGYSGLPKDDPKVTSRTITTHFLDGHQVGKPVEYASHSSTSYWFRTGELPVGRHTIRMETDYEFRRENETYSGRSESPVYEFEIIADTSDHLLAPADDEIDKQVRDSLSIDETLAQSSVGLKGWQPQIRWEDSDEESAGSLHTPYWTVRKPLPVDLCFEAEFRIEGADENIRAGGLQVLAGKKQSFYFMPADVCNHTNAMLQKHADKDGFVKVKVILTPSRAAAVTNPQVKRYYGGTITSDVVRLRIDHDEIGDDFDRNFNLPGGDFN